jgi:hypothetical protein
VDETGKNVELTTQTAIENLMEVFARFGLMEVLVSDGRPAFIAKRFKEYMTTNSIKHSITPPGHPSTQRTGGEYHKNG